MANLFNTMGSLKLVSPINATQRIFVILTIISLMTVFVNGQSYLKDLTISTDEKLVLDEFKKLMISKLPHDTTHDYMKEDVYLIRWLRSAYFNVQRAEGLLTKHLRWRRESNMDSIQNEDWSDIYRNYKYSLKGRDREGKPQLYVHMGNWDYRAASVSGKSARFNRYIDKMYDESTALVRDLGKKYKNVTQMNLLVNVEGFNLAQHGCLQCIALIIKIINTYETHFPGCANKLIAVNVPAIAEPVVRAGRFAFHPITNKALFVYGTNKLTWWNKLLEDFTPDQIPIDMGGTLQPYDDEDYDVN